MKPVTVIVIFLFSCTSVSKEIKLARFSYNEKPCNSLIVNRRPEYGDGRKDGCIVEGQILLSLKTLAKSEFTGKVQDVATLNPLAGAIIYIYPLDTEEPISTTTDQKGKFSFHLETDVKKINVNYIGYRSLYIDFKRRLN